MRDELIIRRNRFIAYFPVQIKGYLMKPLSNNNRKSNRCQKHSNERNIGREVLIAVSTKELVEFYWINQKRFSGGYRRFPYIVNKEQKK